MVPTWAWLVALGLLLALEVVALVNRQPGDTLSEHVWRWFSVGDRAPFWRLRRVVLLAFMAWLTVHFMTGGFV